MQQLHMMVPKMDNLGNEFQQDSLFDTRLNHEIDQRIKSGLAVESKDEDEPPVVPLDVTRQTLALLDELQKSLVETGSQLLTELADPAADGMQAVAAPPAGASQPAPLREPSEAKTETAEKVETAQGLQTAERKPNIPSIAPAGASDGQPIPETADGDSDSHQFRRPRAFNGPVYPGSVNLSPQQGSIKLGTPTTKPGSASPQAEPVSPAPNQSVLDTGDLPPVTVVAPTKQFPSTMPTPAPSEPVVEPMTASAPQPSSEPPPASNPQLTPVPHPSTVVAPPVMPAIVPPLPAPTFSPPDHAITDQSISPEPSNLLITQSFSLADIQTISGQFFARIPKRIGTAPTAWVVCFVALALLMCILAISSAHRP
jgi:hypothetical protein